MIARPVRALIVAIVASMVIVACGGSSDGTSIATTTVPTSADTSNEATTTSIALTTTSNPASTSGSTSTAPPSAPSTDEPLTDAESAAELASLDALAALLDENGVLPLDVALGVFAATFRPLPGIVAVPGVTIDDGMLLSRIVAGRDDVSAEQLAVFDEFLGADAAVPVEQLADGASADGTPTGGFRRGHATRRVAVDAAATATITEALTFYGNALGFYLPEGWVQVVAQPLVDDRGRPNFDSRTVAATATGQGEVGSLDGCLIRINIDTVPGVERRRSAIAHEVFHCYQRWQDGAVIGAAWIGEGTAAWAGEHFAGGTSLSEFWWARWLQNPERPMSSRSYEAIGLMALLARNGADMYPFMQRLLRSQSFDTVRDELGTDGVSMWGSHYAVEPSWGDSFSVVGVGSINGSPMDRPFVVAVDSGAVTVPDVRFDPATSAMPLNITVAGDVFLFDGGTAHGLARFGDGTVLSISSSRRFCVREGGCACPEGTTARSAELEQVTSRELFVGIGPATQPGLPQLEAMSLERWCTPVPTTTVPAGPSLDPCVTGVWRVDNAAMAVALKATDPSLADARYLGDFIYRFDPDGTMSMEVSGWGGFTARDDTVYIGSSMTGVGSGTWFTDDTLHMLVTSSSPFVVTAGVNVDDQWLSRTDIDIPVAEFGLEAGFVYECTPNTLTVKAMSFGGSGVTGVTLFLIPWQ